MKELTIVNKNGHLVTDSREVAEMVNKRHADLLESIKTYIKYLTNGKFRSLDFFIESEYVDNKGETRPCFLLTRKGCDMVANKTNGEKGVLFTATYVSRFEEMEEKIKSNENYSDPKFLNTMQAVKFIADDLKVNEASRINMYSIACKSVGVDSSFLPNYTDGKVLKSAKDLLKQFNINISSIAFNKVLLEKGFLEEKERASKSKGTKKFKSITEKGLEYGENHKSRNNILETQPLWYEERFSELLSLTINN